MERFGLVGLPNAGKSSLYNALTGSNALAAPYPFATKDPNIGMAKVLDPRLDALAEMSKTQKIVYATVEVVDIGGLVETWVKHLGHADIRIFGRKWIR
ncbi:MAG: GTPase, partial [Acidimicrobiaceae bacterium]